MLAAFPERQEQVSARDLPQRLHWNASSQLFSRVAGLRPGAPIMANRDKRFTVAVKVDLAACLKALGWVLLNFFW